MSVKRKPECLLFRKSRSGGERKLQQSRAVDAEARLSSPQIGCSQKPLRDRDEIGFHRLDRCEMDNRHMTTGGGNRERPVHARNDKLATERKSFHRGKLDR